MARAQVSRRVVVTVLAVGTLLAIAVWPSAIEVESATVSRGPLVGTIEEEGRTRVRDRFVVSAPVTGRLLRIDLESGDRVARGDIIARLQPEMPPLLDARTRAELAAALGNATAVLARARAEQQRADAARDHAQMEASRTRRLVAAGAESERELALRDAEVRFAAEAASAAAFAVTAADAEVQRVKARLVSAPRPNGAIVTVSAPVDGVVLRRLRESETVVAAGEPLLEIGDPNRLEIVADLLSTDAVRVRTGARATVEQWGGEAALDGVVRRVEPSGFTKISALGVEEQRVNVVLDFADNGEACAALGDGYRVEVRVVIWEARDVLRVPSSALVREGEHWAVYVVAGGRARMALVEIGRHNAREAEVISGVDDGDVVIVHPGDRIADGVRITPAHDAAAR
jgi:HlyD family secretion protein